MRLIDADALSELLVKTYETAPTEKALLFVALLLKNNEQVPTVDTTEQEEFAYNEGYAHGLETKRPQGKWGKWVISEIQCPNCFEYCQTDCYSTEELKKCPNCGADMRGGGENE